MYLISYLKNIINLLISNFKVICSFYLCVMLCIYIGTKMELKPKLALQIKVKTYGNI